MNDKLAEFTDVLDKDVKVMRAVGLEFDFGGFVLRRELHHWEIQFEDAEGEQVIIAEREDFTGGKLEFEIDGKKETLPLENFDRVDKFAHACGLI